MSLFDGLNIKDEDKYKYDALEGLIEMSDGIGLVKFERETVLRMIRNLHDLNPKDG